MTSFQKNKNKNDNNVIFVIVLFDRPGECSPEKDCCR